MPQSLAASAAAACGDATSGNVRPTEPGPRRWKTADCASYSSAAPDAVPRKSPARAEASAASGTQASSTARRVAATASWQ
jgi:hypothetical protein